MSNQLEGEGGAPPILATGMKNAFSKTANSKEV